MSSQAIADAKEALPEDVDAEVVTRSGRSVTRVLHTEATDHNAQALITGSSVRGQLGRIVLGSTTDRLVHSSPLPIALVPRGYNSYRTEARRLVFAVDPSRRTQRYYDSVSRLAHWLGIGVEVVTFAVRPSRPTGLGAFTDHGMYSYWWDQVASGHAHHAPLAGADDSAAQPPAPASLSQRLLELTHPRCKRLSMQRPVTAPG